MGQQGDVWRQQRDMYIRVCVRKQFSKIISAQVWKNLEFVMINAFNTASANINHSHTILEECWASFCFWNTQLWGNPLLSLCYILFGNIHRDTVMYPQMITDPSPYFTILIMYLSLKACFLLCHGFEEVLIPNNSYVFIFISLLNIPPK